MQPINIVNLALLAYLIAVLTNGIILTARHQHNSVYRKFVLIMLAFWDIIMIGIFIRFNLDGMVLKINYGVMNAQMLLLGIPCFFSFIAYPTVAVNSKFMKLRNWLWLTLPIAALTAIYMLFCVAVGISPFYQYGTYTELWANITHGDVILRIIMLIVFLFYISFMLLSIWDIVPKYNKYIKENLSDSECNVEWVRRLVIYMLFVTFGYFLITFCNSIYANTYYLFSLILLFSYIVDRTVFHKSLEDYEMFEVKWNKERGYYIVDPLVSNRGVALSKKSDKQICDEIDAWLHRYKAYQRVNFTTSDILADFHDLTSESLTKAFKSKGESFQSYVRRFRIEKACEIIRKSPTEIDQQRLCNLVGFSHYSSFSRAFTAVKGTNPSGYIRTLVDD